MCAGLESFAILFAHRCEWEEVNGLRFIQTRFVVLESGVTSCKLQDDRADPVRLWIEAGFAIAIVLCSSKTGCEGSRSIQDFADLGSSLGGVHRTGQGTFDKAREIGFIERGVSVAAGARGQEGELLRYRLVEQDLGRNMVSRFADTAAVHTPPFVALVSEIFNVLHAGRSVY